MSSIKQIKSFVMVADLKSFTNAADTLYMTQPAVSSQIKVLEESIGLPLILRSDKRVELTEAGKHFYRQAKEVITAYERAIEVMDDFKGLKRGRLSLGASTIPGEYLLPRFIGKFHKQYPGIVISLKAGDTGSVLELLLSRKIDLGVVGARLEYGDVEFVPFVRDELVLIGPAGWDLPTVIYPSDLLEMDLVVRETNSGTRMVLKEIFSQCGIREQDLKISMELGSSQAVITAVASDIGVGFVSRWAAETALKAGSVKLVGVQGLNLERDLYIITLKNSCYTRARDIFVDFLINNDL